MSDRVSHEGSTDEPEETHDRPLTIDDVPRLGSGAGVAIGCGFLVVIAVAVFWFIRGWLMQGQ